MPNYRAEMSHGFGSRRAVAGGRTTGRYHSRAFTTHQMRGGSLACSGVLAYAGERGALALGLIAVGCSVCLRTVTNRTREIGIHAALVAHCSDIIRRILATSELRCWWGDCRLLGAMWLCAAPGRLACRSPMSFGPHGAQRVSVGCVADPMLPR